MSIFTRLTAENENSTTELLVNLLKHHVILRNTILRYLCEGITDNQINTITEKSITPQKRTTLSGQFDFTIKSEKVFVIFENKIRLHTGLTEHEKVDYIKLVQESNAEYKKLIFCIPEEYNDNDIKTIKEIKNQNPDLVLIITWEGFIEYLQVNKFDELNPLCKEAIDFFTSVIDIKTSNKKIEWTVGEAIMIFNPSEMFDALGAVSNIFKKIAASDAEIIAGLNDTCEGNFTASDWDQLSSQYSYAKFINNKNINDECKEMNLFYGLRDFKDKELNSKFSFCVGVKKEIVKECSAIETFSDENGWVYISMNKRVLFDDDNNSFINEVVSSFRKLLPEK